jgi:alpha-tubulin suppressor-like RCC1 family protein
MQTPKKDSQRIILERILKDKNSYSSILPKDVRELVLNLVIGRAYVFGDSQNNKFGDITDKNEITIPIKLKMNVKDIAFGEGYTLVLTMSGELFVSGLISENTMGLTDEEEDHLYSIYSDILLIGGGEYRGKLLVTIDKFLNLTLLKEFPHKIIKISSGKSHVLILTESGDCYSFGNNDHGQLGTDSRNAENQWNHIANNVLDIGCGHNHSGYLTTEHQLYLFGSNLVKQLAGMTTQTQLYKPTLYNIPNKIQQIFIQGSHTCYITNGYLYCCGVNASNKFGLPSYINYIINPTLMVDEFDQPLINVDKIVMAFGHILILANNNVYICGSNASNPLGLGDNVTLDRIRLLEQFSDGKTTDIAGNNMNSVIIHDKIGYYSGNTTTRFTPMPMFTESFVKSITDIRVVGGYGSYAFCIN